MKIARKSPEATLGAATSQIRLLRGSRETESGSTSPKMIISLSLEWSRIKNAELSTVDEVASFTFDEGTKRGERAGEKNLTGKAD